jgi:hypothetical protein
MASQMNFEVILIIPSEAQDKIWIPSDQTTSNITIISLEENVDYLDAILFAKKLSSTSEMDSEGGAHKIHVKLVQKKS